MWCCERWLARPFRAWNMLTHVRQVCRHCNCYTDDSTLVQFILMLCFHSVPYFASLIASMDEATPGSEILCQLFFQVVMSHCNLISRGCNGWWHFCRPTPHKLTTTSSHSLSYATSPESVIWIIQQLCDHYRNTVIYLFFHYLFLASFSPIYPALTRASVLSLHLLCPVLFSPDSGFHPGCIHSSSFFNLLPYWLVPQWQQI